MQTQIILERQYSDAQLSRVLEQSIIYSCACPAQVCKAIFQARDLFSYQAQCLNSTGTDTAVHQTIAETVKHNHLALEQCLTEVLRLEGWAMDTLSMPADLQKRLLDDLNGER